MDDGSIERCPSLRGAGHLWLSLCLEHTRCKSTLYLPSNLCHDSLLVSFLYCCWHSFLFPLSSLSRLRQMTLFGGSTWSEAKGNEVVESSSWVWQWWIWWSSSVTQDGAAEDKSVFVFNAYLYSCFIYFHSLLFPNFSYVTLINYFLWITCLTKW